MQKQMELELRERLVMVLQQNSYKRLLIGNVTQLKGIMNY